VNTGNSYGRDRGGGRALSRKSVQEVDPSKGDYIGCPVKKLQRRKERNGAIFIGQLDSISDPIRQGREEERCNAKRRDSRTKGGALEHGHAGQGKNGWAHKIDRAGNAEGTVYKRKTVKTKSQIRGRKGEGNDSVPSYEGGEECGAMIPRKKHEENVNDEIFIITKPKARKQTNTSRKRP